ncbi:hypothetical protein [Leptolyngbya sp. FACHB-671]|uniref:hypothetical protein n=1 Tax=Leptolyngbya sp. FACHB-671 TaxID=2692812 RepID=UPI001A7E86DB|nr:hypothetical protein [Leptolyngbya sp. FACHB-671]
MSQSKAEYKYDSRLSIPSVGAWHCHAPTEFISKTWDGAIAIKYPNSIRSA